MALHRPADYAATPLSVTPRLSGAIILKTNKEAGEHAPAATRLSTRLRPLHRERVRTPQPRESFVQPAHRPIPLGPARRPPPQPTLLCLSSLKTEKMSPMNRLSIDWYCPCVRTSSCPSEFADHGGKVRRNQKKKKRTRRVRRGVKGER